MFHEIVFLECEIRKHISNNRGKHFIIYIYLFKSFKNFNKTELSLILRIAFSFTFKLHLIKYCFKKENRMRKHTKNKSLSLTTKSYKQDSIIT